MSNILLIDTFEVSPLKLKSDRVQKVDLLDREQVLESVVKKSREGLNKVLGILEGPYFIPGGISRNKRVYPPQLWERVVAEVREDLKTRGRLGTLEHPMREGEDHPKHASHILKDLWIRGDLGYGKSYVLNTPMGSLVHTLCSATDEEGQALLKLFVSSRAMGSFSGKDSQGNDIVDPNNFIFQTFDLVLDPGFYEATPEFRPVVESLIQEILESHFDQKSYAVPTPKVTPPPAEPELGPSSENSLMELVKEAGAMLETGLNSTSQLEAAPGANSRYSTSGSGGSSLQKLQEDYRVLTEENQKLRQALKLLREQYEQTQLELLAYRYELPTSEVNRLLKRFKKLDVLETFLEESKRFMVPPKIRTVQLGEGARIESETPARSATGNWQEDWSYQTMEEILKRFGGN